MELYLKEFDTIRLAGIIRESIVDGPGLRFTIFSQGCPHGCKGCHNPETHSFDGGYDCSLEKIFNAIIENPLLDGLTFSGGEPFLQPEAYLNIAKFAKERGLNIVCYSGYTFEELIKLANGEIPTVKNHNEKSTDSSRKSAIKELLDTIDILIDGKFVEEERDLSLLFRGSKNQRVLDMNLSRKNGFATPDERYI